MKIFGYELKKKADPQPAASTSVGDVVTNKNESPIMKAYIPEFLYKPPFGYPRKENIPLIRELSKNPYIYGVVKTLGDEAASTEYDVVYKKDVDPTPALDLVREEILKFFDNPNANKESFQHILRASIKDICEVDAGVWVKVYNEAGQFNQLFARDGGSFLKNPDIYGYMGNREEYVKPTNINYAVTPESPDYSATLNRYQLQFKETAAYFQYGTTAFALPVPFGLKEIVYLMNNPQSNNVYGISPISILADIILTLTYGANYNLDFYMNNNMPEGILSMLGGDADSIKGMRERLDNTVRVKDKITGFMRKIFFKIPISNQEVKFTPFQLDPKVMQVLEQQDWFTKLVWSCFGITADEMGFCYSEDTRVLTNNGLKYHWELTEEDQIATVNPVNKEIGYLKPESINVFKVEDRSFHHYKNSCVDLLVSDDHRLLYRTPKVKEYCMNPSNEITINTVKFLQGDLKWIGKKTDEFKIPFVGYNNNKYKNRSQITDFEINDFCELMGYYLSEGRVLFGKEQFYVKISQTSEEGIKIMSPLMDKIGFIREKDCWKIGNKSLAIYLHQFGDSNQKYLPEEIKSLPVEQLKILLDALITGDGHRDGSSIRYSSNSKRLAEDVLELMLKIGYKASLKKREFKNKNCNTNYIVSGNLTLLEPRVIISKQREELKYTGLMWCPSVHNRPFITERNGKIGIHYNTDKSNKATSETQANVYKRKAVRPMLALIKYHIDKEIIPEWGEEAFNSLEWKWDDYDLEEDLKKHELYQKQVNIGIKTAEMIAEEEGINVEELKKQKEEAEAKEMDKFERQSEFGNQELKPTKENTLSSTKAFPKGINTPVEKQYSQDLTKMLKTREQSALIEINKLYDPNGSSTVLAGVAISALTVPTLIEGIKSLVRKSYYDGYGFEGAVEFGANVNQEVVKELEEYNFDLIQNLNEELSNKLKSTLKRAYLENKPKSQVIEEVKGLFDKDEVRANAIVRTEMSRAENAGILQKAQQSEIQQTKSISNPDPTSTICKRMIKKYEGKNLSLNNNFTDDVTGESWSHPPFHVNCKTNLITEAKK